MVKTIVTARTLGDFNSEGVISPCLYVWIRDTQRSLILLQTIEGLIEEVIIDRDYFVIPYKFLSAISHLINLDSDVVYEVAINWFSGFRQDTINNVVRLLEKFNDLSSRPLVIQDDFSYDPLDETWMIGDQLYDPGQLNRNFYLKSEGSINKLMDLIDRDLVRNEKDIYMIKRAIDDFYPF